MFVQNTVDGNKCENKNGKICFTFLSWKGWTIVIKKTLPL